MESPGPVIKNWETALPIIIAFPAFSGKSALSALSAINSAAAAIVYG